MLSIQIIIRRFNGSFGRIETSFKRHVQCIIWGRSYISSTIRITKYFKEETWYTSGGQPADKTWLNNGKCHRYHLYNFPLSAVVTYFANHTVPSPLCEYYLLLDGNGNFSYFALLRLHFLCALYETAYEFIMKR